MATERKWTNKQDDVHDVLAEDLNVAFDDIYDNIDILSETKVTKEENKGLSENDFSDLYKNKVDNIPNDITSELSAKQNITDNNLTTVSKQIVGAINEIKSGLTIKTIETTANEEKPTLGAELVNSDDWVYGLDWGGDLENGFTYSHTEGTEVLPLTFLLDGEENSYYQIEFKSSVALTDTNLRVKIGGTDLFPLYGQVSATSQPIIVGIKAKKDTYNNCDVEFVPDATYNGTITDISIKKILNPSNATIKLIDTNNDISEEFRFCTENEQSIFIGKSSGQYNDNGKGNVGFGYNALSENTSGFWNVGIGLEALKENTVGSRNIGIGYGALSKNIIGNRNISIGSFSLIKNTTGSHNIAIGADCMNDNVSGDSNVAIGFQAMYKSTSSQNNVAIGRESIKRITSGQFNIGIGFQSLDNVTTGNNNIGIGIQALHNCIIGVNNVGIGDSAGQGCQGDNNVAIGQHSLFTAGVKSDNISIGYYAGQKMTTGEKNILLGRLTGKEITTGTNNILLGSGLDTDSPTTNYQIKIGNLLKGSHDTTQSDRYLTVDGALNVELASTLKGDVKMTTLPTTNPSVAGQLWADNGILKVSGATYLDFATLVNGTVPANQLPIVTSISSSSTDTQTPSAKCVYDIVGNIESLLDNINDNLEAIL